MRILVASHNYPRFHGDPAGFYVRQLALGFQQRGHDVLVVVPHVAGTAEKELEDGVSVLRFRYAPERLEQVGYRGEARPSRLLAAPFLPCYLLAFRSALVGAVREFQPDIIHAHWWLPAGRLVSRLGVPFLITSHGSDVRLMERSASLRRAARGVALRARRWTAASRFLARDIERQLDLAGEAVAVTPMPIDLAEFEAGQAIAKVSPPRILFAGNLLQSKGVDVLIEAVAILRGRNIPLGLRILGQGPYEPALREQIRRLRLEGVVSIYPFVPRSAMPAEFGAATVTVLPTRGQAEGLGLVLVEALLAGSAIVGTPAGGIPEVVLDHQTGLLVPDGDPNALADALDRLLTERTLRERLVAGGQAHVRQLYSVDASVDRFLALFADVTHGQPQY
ncbi:MAG TPA: glycosyltransferase [Gemmatimonadales bacterium]|nr:glycosyltransferase [Gemmatimonadales bacterium]